LTQKETSTKGGGRRKSGFAEEEEGYMFVEEGFRIRFTNGEVIDFYADSAECKHEWIKVLTQIIGKCPAGPVAAIRPWVETVLKREKSVMAREGKVNEAGTGPSKTNLDSQMASRNAHSTQATGLAIQQPYLSQGIPSQTKVAPKPQGHMRTESYHPQSGSRSQASSPVKSKVTKDERNRKAKSMQWH
jgi:hypothetical protein